MNRLPHLNQFEWDLTVSAEEPGVEVLNEPVETLSEGPSTPKAKANCKFNLQEWTLRKLSESIDELREAGVTDSEIRNAFAGAINRQTPMK